MRRNHFVRPPRLAVAPEDRHAAASAVQAQRSKDLRALQISPHAQQTVDFWLQRYEKPEFIYFIRPRSGEGPVKIGRALDPHKRLLILQCGCWVPLAIWTVILSAGPETEGTLHRHWAAARVHGEWFGLGMEDEILATAEQIGNVQIEAHGAGVQLDHLVRTIPRFTLEQQREAA